MPFFLGAEERECATSTPGEKGCSCGSKVKLRDQLSCKKEEGKTSKCPCVRKGEPCKRKCKCRHCSNNNIELKGERKRGCRCGEERKTKDPSFVSCIDLEGKKMSRCPCYGNKARCDDTCKCYNCRNTFGARSTDKIEDAPKLKRKKIVSSPPSLKRRRGTQYVKESNMPGINGQWTQLETCILHMVESFLYASSVLPSQENIHHLYNFVVQSNAAQLLKITAYVKSCLQITGKLLYLKKREEEIRKLNFGIDAVL